MFKLKVRKIKLKVLEFFNNFHLSCNFKVLEKETTRNWWSKP